MSKLENGRPESLPLPLPTWVQWVTAKPWQVIALALCLVVALLSQLPKLTFDTSMEGFLKADDPARVEFNAFKDYFGRSEPTVLMIRLPEQLGDARFLEKLSRLHRDIETEVPNVRRVTSLMNIRNMRMQGDVLEIGDLVEELPQTPEQLAAFEERVRSSELYPHFVISPDESWTMLWFESEVYAQEPASAEDDAALTSGFAESAETSNDSSRREISADEDGEMLAVVREVIARHAASDFEIRLAGSLVFEQVLGKALRVDFVSLLLVAMAVISILLLVLYRSLATALLIISVVLLSLLGTIGVMASVGAPVTLGTQVLPTLLLAIGVGYSVHVVTLFRSRRAAGAMPRRAIQEALTRCARPIGLTAITTIAGFASFAPTELVPAAQIGYFAPVGVVLAAIFSLTLLPAALIVLPIRIRAHHGFPRVRAALVGMGLFAGRHREVVMVGWFLLLGVALLGIARLETGHNPSSWLRFEDDLNEAVALVGDQMGGATMIELLIEMKEGESLRDPAVLSAMDEISDYAMQLEIGPQRAAKAVGLHTVVKEINKSLEGGSRAAYRVPEDPALVAQELLLFENAGTDDLEELVDTSYSVGRLSIRVQWVDAAFTKAFGDQVLAEARRVLGDRAELRLGGIEVLTKRAFLAVNESMMTSYVLAFIVVTALIVFMVGDIRVGLVAMIPNLMPILVAMGFMGWFEIPLSTFTLLVGSVVLGLVVDDTIHVAHRFVEERKREGASAESALSETLGSTGIALVFTSGALALGFLAYALGSLWPMLHFGVVAAFAILVALAADLILLPVLLLGLFGNERASAEDPARVPVDSDWAPQT